MSKKISRSQWDQIHKRVKLADFQFDPDWKCLIDGKRYRECLDHDEIDQAEAIQGVKDRYSGSSV